MNNWKKIKVNGIAKITKCVSEFEIWELNKTPYAKFKIKIYEDINGEFTGYTNLRVKTSEDDDFYGGVGYGTTIEEALQDTINDLMEKLNEKEVWEETEFDWSHPDDF